MPTDLVSKLDAIHAQKLVELAHERFSDELNEAEHRWLELGEMQTAAEG